MNKKSICIVTGSRSEYGLLSGLMKEIKEDPKFKLQIIATGMHLSPTFGLTYKQIERDGFEINNKIEMLLSADTPSSITKSSGIGLIGFADAFEQLKPDLIVLVGDRYEVLSGAIAALYAKIPIAHIHGGEVTQGAYDEAIRHSITKMASFHFVANVKYLKRIIQLGENPKKIFNVGGLGVDYINRTTLLTKDILSKKLGLKFQKRNLLVTYHPVTLDNNPAEKHFQNLLDALDEVIDIYIIFTMPNSDSDSLVIKKMINKYVSKNKNRSIAFSSMGNLNYLSALKFVDGMVGNSSSGLLEAPTFNIGTINIGDRQKGRLKAKSIIDCNATKSSIISAIKKLYSKKFQNSLLNIQNPYGEGNSTERIMKILRKIEFPVDIKKQFYDLKNT